MEWTLIAHSDAPIACHMTIKESENWEGASQCRGAASYRANVGKMPRDPEITHGPKDSEIFASPIEFSQHHNQLRKAQT
jgi:hypothetical protein